MKNFLIITLLLLCPFGARCEDGDVFIAQTPEGSPMNFMVISEQDKTVCVGNEYDPAIDRGIKGRITIPNVANGYKVTRIGKRAFLKCDQIEEIVIPQGITTIGDHAFNSCENLQSMTIPEGVKSIGQSAFAWCEELESIVIPSTVTEFGLWIFMECRNLQSVYSAIQSPLSVNPMSFSVNYPPEPDETNTHNYDTGDFELYIDATLYVPVRCKEKYQETEGWNLFKYTVEDKAEIGGLKYVLHEDHTAMVANGNQWEGELDIPEQVTYDGEAYTVNSLEWQAFNSCKTLTKVRIPKTVASIEHYDNNDDCKNPFEGCASLETIEVDEENPWMCSADGVLFNKEKTWLYCFPAGTKREIYNIQEGVERIGGCAFSNNLYLTSVNLPNSVTRMDFGAFSGCKSLCAIRLSENLKYVPPYTFEKCESLHILDIPVNVSEFAESVFRWSPIKTLVIRGTFSEELRKDTFYAMDEEAVVYVRKTEIEKFQKVFSGTILPLEEYHTSDINELDTKTFKSSYTYDFTGAQMPASPIRGIYIQNGKKVLLK